MKKVDTIIKGGTIVTMDTQYRVLNAHFIAIDEGKILGIFPELELKNYKARNKVDATGCLITPGFINTHSHMPMSYFRGLADDLPLDTWLNHYIWPMEAQMLTPEYVHHASLHSAFEMIRQGITFTNDMYFHNEQVADACTEAGIRVNISEAIIGNNFKGDPGKIGESVSRLKELYQDNPLVDCTIAPHAIYTCSGEILEACADAAIANNWLIHTHLSETRKELEDCLKEHGKRPLEYLESLGFLEARCIFAHGVWLSGQELSKLADTQCAISLCIDSNLKLGSGIAPLKDMLEHKVSLSIGTDGVASNNNLDILEEASTLAKLHKGINHDPTLLPARDAFELLTIKGAKALGREHDLGSLEQGKQADLAIIHCSDVSSQPMYNPYSHLIYTIGSEQIRDLMVAGKWVMKDRQVVNLKEDEIIQNAKHYKDEMLKVLEQ